MMKNSGGQVIYIGKAANLKSRVRSYFTPKNERPQVFYLMRETADVDYIVSQNEHEALILENSLIKKHKPKFNIQLKDDKTYASLRLSMNEDFPRLSIARRVTGDGASYFGPFSSGGALRRTAKLVHKLFPVRDCPNSKFKQHSKRPCLNYDMQVCCGPCAGMTGKSEYREICLGAEKFLKNGGRQITALLRKKMKKSADEMRYEDASYYRDQLDAIRSNFGGEKVVSSSFTDRDVIETAADEKSFEFVVLFHRGGSFADKAEFSAKNTGADTAQAIGEFMGRFYDGGRQIPPEIVVPAEPRDKRIYEQWLTEKRGGTVRIVAPKRGLKAKLLRMAWDNASEAIRKKRAGEEKNKDILFGLKKALKLSRTPRAIECFDISNTQGREKTGSSVRFSDGEPEKKFYKIYRIKTVSGQDDFASIKEALSRRLKRAGQPGWDLPDLILIDGGKGQLSAAVETMKENGFYGSVDIAAIAKARTKKEGDAIYTPGRKTPWTPLKNKQGLFLLMRVRDEAHRFALNYHRKLRRKKFFDRSGGRKD